MKFFTALLAAIALASASAVTELTASNFDAEIADGVNFVKVHAFFAWRRFLKLTFSTYPLV